ncbi:hypothetical protein BD309DRAFT_775205 [Dichomitus squalens]|uniref:Uncharacterized protein n=1 Tax=Dichomitus squalens TaxID=114155 RepID=A0A4Q9NVB3_9APHY|nr:hypothetical protein BD309DRAFT_775205 [Dichomitus squalens]TBU59561.1 hypothetical protein BD310DRAFT_411087 [Dichomitus squalens]
MVFALIPEVRHVQPGLVFSLHRTSRAATWKCKAHGPSYQVEAQDCNARGILPAESGRRDSIYGTPMSHRPKELQESQRMSSFVTWPCLPSFHCDHRRRAHRVSDGPTQARTSRHVSQVACWPATNAGRKRTNYSNYEYSIHDDPLVEIRHGQKYSGRIGASADSGKPDV